MTPTTLSRSRTLLTAACAVLVGMPAGSTSAQEDVAPAQAVLNPLAALDPSRLEGFLGRPLFTTSRKAPLPPAEAPPPASDGQAEMRPDLHLLGILQTSNESVAQLSEGTGSERYSVRVGDVLGDWVVTDIDRSSLTLANGEQTISLELFKSRRKDENVPAGEDAEGGWRAPPPTEASPSQAWTSEDLKDFFGSK